MGHGVSGGGEALHPGDGGWAAARIGHGDQVHKGRADALTGPGGALLRAGIAPQQQGEAGDGHLANRRGGKISVPRQHLDEPRERALRRCELAEGGGGVLQLGKVADHRLLQHRLPGLGIVAHIAGGDLLDQALEALGIPGLHPAHHPVIALAGEGEAG